MNKTKIYLTTQNLIVLFLIQILDIFDILKPGICFRLMEYDYTLIQGTVH